MCIFNSLIELQEFFYDPDYLPFQEKTRRVLKINCDFFWKTANTFLVASSHFILPGKIYGFYQGCTISSNLVPFLQKKTMYIKCYYIKYKCIFKCRRATIRSKNLIRNSIKKFWLLQRKRIASTVLENKFIKLLAQEICCSP